MPSERDDASEWKAGRTYLSDRSRLEQTFSRARVRQRSRYAHVDMSNRIAILGWGSLIYDLGELESHVGSDWKDGGPQLQIEFSRVSSSRDGALTLVIDEENGVNIPTQYILSSRSNPEDAVCDLRDREGTVRRYIGILDFTDEIERCKSPEVAARIRDWATGRNLRAVIWTDLPSNFTEKSKTDDGGPVPFSIDAAIQHLNLLDEKTRQKARKYIRKAPEYVKTPLRDRLQDEGWIGE